jgi:hypothetical protein
MNGKVVDWNIIRPEMPVNQTNQSTSFNTLKCKTSKGIVTFKFCCHRRLFSLSLSLITIFSLCKFQYFKGLNNVSLPLISVSINQWVIFKTVFDVVYPPNLFRSFCHETKADSFKYFSRFLKYFDFFLFNVSNVFYFHWCFSERIFRFCSIETS